MLNFIRLVTKEVVQTKSQLLSRLESLNVWGVQAITLTQEVDDIIVNKNTDHVLFDDSDDSKLEMYLSIKDSRPTMVDFEISKEFIRLCGITEPRFQNLVLPIIQCPQEDIGKFLEEYGLDEPGDDKERPIDLLQFDSEGSDNEVENGSSFEVDVTTLSLPRTPNSGMNDNLLRKSSFETYRPSSILKERIPELDQSISFVQRAAALPTATTAIITPSQISINTSPSFDSVSLGNLQHSTGRNDSPSASNAIHKANQAACATMELEAEIPHDAFDFTGFQSEFSEAFGQDTPSQRQYISSTQQHSSTWSHSRSSHAHRMNPPEPEATMLGLQMQKTGLLGEVFVSNTIRYITNRFQPPYSQLIDQ